ncbi:MAG: multiprotein bridging factor aMBF1 [Candidatus Helarchaeales archaeon]
MKRKQDNTCEICGRIIEGPVRYRFIDANVKLRVCQNCSRFGQDIGKKQGLKPHSGPKFMPTRQKSPARKPKSRTRIEDLDLIDEFGAAIRQARQKANLTQEQLGKTIKEPASFIKKIEQEKIHPSIDVIRKLERVLKISLLERTRDKELDFKVISGKSSPRAQTLEDIIVFRKKKEKSE